MERMVVLFELVECELGGTNSFRKKTTLSAVVVVPFDTSERFPC